MCLGVLGRLDDPSGEVREYAVQSLAVLSLQPSNERELDSWETILKHVLSTLLLHLDSAELKLRTTVIGKLFVFFKITRNNKRNVLFF